MTSDLKLDQIIDLLEHSLSGHEWSCYVADDDRTELTADTRQHTTSLRKIRSTSVSVSLGSGQLKVDLATSDCSPAGLARLLSRIGKSTLPSSHQADPLPAPSAPAADSVAVLTTAASALATGLAANDARLLLSQRRRTFTVRTTEGAVFSSSGARFNRIAAVSLPSTPIRYYEVAAGTSDVLTAGQIEQSLEQLGRVAQGTSAEPNRDSLIVLSPFAAAQLLNAVGDAALRTRRDPTESVPGQGVVDRLGPDPLRSSLDESGTDHEVLDVWPHDGSRRRDGRLWRAEIDGLPDRTWFGLGVPAAAPVELPDDVTLVLGFESLQQAVRSPFAPVEVRALVATGSQGQAATRPAVRRVQVSLDQAVQSARPAGSEQLMVLRHTTWVGALAIDGDGVRAVDS